MGTEGCCQTCATKLHYFAHEDLDWGQSMKKKKKKLKSMGLPDANALLLLKLVTDYYEGWKIFQ